MNPSTTNNRSFVYIQPTVEAKKFVQVAGIVMHTSY